MTEQLVSSESDRAVFRPVHYLGCKLRVLDVLERALDFVEPTAGGLLDLFSGTGVVAAHLASSRPVIAADVQEYARVLASALLAGEAPSRLEAVELVATATRNCARAASEGMAALIEHERESVVRAEAGDPESFCSVIENGSLFRSAIECPSDPRLARLLTRALKDTATGPETVITRYYGGVYFSYEQALMLDQLATAVRMLPQPSRDVGLAAVMSTASDVVTSVGNQFAQPIRPRESDGRPKSAALRGAARQRRLSVDELFLMWMDRYASLPAPAYESVAVRRDFKDALADPPAPVSVVYADPPYTRDHYSRYYHVLETVALGDEPEVSFMRLGDATLVSRGLYRDQRHQSPFCIKSQAPRAFAELFAGARHLNVPIVVSYSPHGEGSASRPRLMAIDDIVGIASRWYGEVDVISAGRLAHSKLNASRLNFETVYDAELLIACRA
jgi:adenine-specific DNA-methyltransferase